MPSAIEFDDWEILQHAILGLVTPMPLIVVTYSCCLF
jgi:hypothetical protein